VYARAIVLLIVLVTVAYRAEGSDPQSRGLAEELPTDTVEADGYVPYEGIPSQVGPVSNGPPRFTPSDVTRDEVFAEDRAARLPDGARIERHWDCLGREIWEYPVGTRVVHRFFLKTIPSESLFEMRVVEKLPDGRWAFGVYEWRGDRLQLRHVMSHDVFDLDLLGGRVRAEMDRLHPESCRICHYNHSSQSYQFEDPEHAGPCEFGPGNPLILTHWAVGYAARYGYWPFAN
jgi:hypothetical protein